MPADNLSLNNAERRPGAGFKDIVFLSSIGSSGRVGGGPRNMKSMWPPLAAIFFMTCFYRARGGPWPPRPPPGSATVIYCLNQAKIFI